MKTVLRGKFRVIQGYLNKIEKSQINNLTLHLQELEEQKQAKPRVSRWKEIIKIRAKSEREDGSEVGGSRVHFPLGTGETPS